VPGVICLLVGVGWCPFNGAYENLNKFKGKILDSIGSRSQTDEFGDMPLPKSALQVLWKDQTTVSCDHMAADEAKLDLCVEVVVVLLKHEKAQLTQGYERVWRDMNKWPWPLEGPLSEGPWEQRCTPSKAVRPVRGAGCSWRKA